MKVRKCFPYDGVTLFYLNFCMEDHFNRRGLGLSGLIHLLPPVHHYSSVYFWHQYHRCDWYFNGDLTPSLQIFTQTNDSDQLFPSLKLLSLSASTELMLRSCSGLSTPLMVQVVKADACLLCYHSCCYLLFIQCYCCLWNFTENTGPWPWGAPTLLSIECRRGVKRKPWSEGRGDTHWEGWA